MTKKETLRFVRLAIPTDWRVCWDGDNIRAVSCGCFGNIEVQHKDPRVVISTVLAFQTALSTGAAIEADFEVDP